MGQSTSLKFDFWLRCSKMKRSQGKTVFREPTRNGTEQGTQRGIRTRAFKGLYKNHQEEPWGHSRNTHWSWKGKLSCRETSDIYGCCMQILRGTNIYPNHEYISSGIVFDTYKTVHTSSFYFGKKLSNYSGRKKNCCIQ